MSSPLELWSEYGDLYNEIVRPERKYVITHYLRTRWGPLLGAARLWFIVALRQRCFWNDKQDWCVVDLETLAQEAGISLRTANRIVGESEAPSRDEYVSWFFTRVRRRRYSKRAHKTVNAPNRYHVLLDDPLTPQDQIRLIGYLRSTVDDDSPATTLRAIESLCAQSGKALNEKLSDASTADASTSSDEVIPAAYVLDVVQACCPMPPRESDEYAAIARACSRLHNAITRPEHVYIGNQYFRLEWLPILGPTLALLIVNLRARCYWNEHTGELRETCRASWSELAREIGCTARQLRNLRNRPPLANFIQVVAEGRGRAPATFRVRMPDPLTEQDQQTFERRLKAPSDTIRDPETGQLALRALLENAEILAQSEPSRSQTSRLQAQSDAHNAEILASGTKETEILALRKRKFWHLEGLNAEILALECGNFGTNKVLVITFSTKGLVETTLPAMSEAELAVALLHTLLERMNIQEPGLSRLLTMRPRCDDVAAWSLYALTQAGLKTNKAGYVYRRLIAGDRPPAECLEMVALPPSVWRSFYQARRRGQVPSDPSLQKVFERWSELLSPVWDSFSFEFLPVEEATMPSSPSDNLPAELRELLRDDELVERGDAWHICTTDPFRACHLTHAIARLELGDVATVLLLDEQGNACLPSAEVLAFSGRPLAVQVWTAATEELRWQMPRQVFDHRWRRVRPLGIVGDGDQECVVLGVFTVEDRDWLTVNHSALASRTLSGVLGRSVSVRFVTCVDETEAIPVIP